MKKSEASFIKKLQDQETSDIAFSQLLEQYQERLYWHIRKIILLHEDSCDVLQNTFIKIFKGIPNFKQKSSLHTWMYRIAYNESLNFLASKKKRLRIDSEELNSKLLNELQEDVYFEGDAIQLKLQEALLQLPKKQKEVFILKYYDALKYKDIAKILGTSEGALKASYHLAVKKLEQFLIQAT